MHRFALLVPILFLNLQAIRDERFNYMDTDKAEEPAAPNLCPEARIVSKTSVPTAFELDYIHARDLNFMDSWSLKADAGCQGPPVCRASVAPVINSTNPYGSKALITVWSDCKGSLLYLCEVTAARHCIAAITLPSPGFRLRRLVSFALSTRRMQRLDALQSIVQDYLLEGTMLLNVLIAISAVFWLLREVFLLFRAPASNLLADEVDGQLLIPEATDIMRAGMMDALRFVLGCVLLVLAASTFLKKFGMNDNPSDAIILAYPMIFGPAALLRIFLCISRRLLYHTLLKFGVVIDFSNGVSQHDFLLAWSYLGFLTVGGILIIDACRRVHAGSITVKAMMINFIVFATPLNYMASSLQNSLRLEQEAIQHMCTLKLEKKKCDDEALLSTTHMLRPVPESSICIAGRQRKHLRASILTAKQAAAGAERFGLRDMFWVPRLVSDSGKLNLGTLLLVVSMPAMALLTMFLAFVSTAWFIKHRTDVPEMTSVVTDVPGLHPTFTPEVQNYVLFALDTYASVTLTSKADPDRTTFLKNAVFDGSSELEDAGSEETTSGVLIHTVSLQRLNATQYPITIHLTAGTFSQVQTYRVAVLHVKPHFRELMLRCSMDSGEAYQACFMGKNIQQSVLSIPGRSKAVQVEAGLDQFYFGIPFQSARPDKVTTVYKLFAEHSALRKWGCEGWCQRKLQCIGVLQSGDACYAAMSPSVSVCGEGHEQSSHFWKEDLNYLMVRICTDESLTKCMAATATRTGLLKADLSALLLPDGKLQEHPAVTFQAALKTASSLHSFLQQKVAFQPDTPKVLLLVQGGPLMHRSNVIAVETTESTASSVAGPNLTTQQRFDISLRYDAMYIQASTIQLSLAAVLRDPQFYIEWTSKKLQLLEKSNSDECEADVQKMVTYDACGGEGSTSLVTAQIDKWSPTSYFHGFVRPRIPQSLFNIREVNVFVNFAEQMQPLQALVRNDCKISICRGNFDKCVADLCNSSRFDSKCQQSCAREAYQVCQYEHQQGKAYLGMLQPQEMDPLNQRLFFREKVLQSWIDVMIFPDFRKLFSMEVITDIAGTCKYGTGLLSLVRPWILHNLSSPMILPLVEALAGNPDPELKLDMPFRKSPILLTIFEASAAAFLRRLPLELVTIFRPKLRKLTLAVCLHTDPKLIKFHLFEYFIERLYSQGTASEDPSEKGLPSARQALIALADCVKRKGRIFKKFPSESCLSETFSYEDGSRQSLFSLATDETVFTLLTQVCKVDGELEQNGRTVLHIAAQKQYAEALNFVLDRKIRKERDRPEVDAEIKAIRTVGDDVKLLMSNVTALHDACHANCGRCTRLLLQHGANAQATLFVKLFPTSWYNTLQRWMYKAFARFTREKNKTVEFPVLEGLQPIHLAAKRGCHTCIEHLNKLQVNINARSMLGLEYNEYTIHASGEFSQQSSSGKGACLMRPLDLALAYGHDLSAQYLIRAGADTTRITVDSGSKLVNTERLKRLGIINMTTNTTPQLIKCRLWTVSNTTNRKEVSPGALMRAL